MNEKQTPDEEIHTTQHSYFLTCQCCNLTLVPIDFSKPGELKEERPPDKAQEIATTVIGLQIQMRLGES